MNQTKYSIYIPSRGRWEKSHTIDILLENKIPFYVVVEPQEEREYKRKFDRNVLVMHKDNQGIAYARNWIKKYSTLKGEAFHWQVDDNIKNFRRRVEGKNIKTKPFPLLQEVEEFCDRYENIAIAGLKHYLFAFAEKKDLSINRQVYSCVLVNNAVDVSWRTGVVDDLDYSLQVLSKGYCTVLFNRLLIEKETTMKQKGGNTEIEYQGDGRLKRALGTQEAWPNTFEIVEKNGVVRLKPSRIWQTFKQELKERKDES